MGKMSTCEDILTDVVVFLRDILASEDLSVSANQRRLVLLQRILNRDCVPLPYVDMNGCRKSIINSESHGECYEELESSWSGSAGSNNVSGTYSNSLPAISKQTFRFFFGNTLDDSKSKELTKTCFDSTDFPVDTSKRNSVLSDSDNSLSPSSVKSEDCTGIMSISASAIKYSAIKYGLLVRKEKTLFFEHSKRLWVALLGTTLFVYTSEKDSKPSCSINVDDYNARPIASIHANKKEFGFEIICPGKKTYQFYSNSKSDMEMWIETINHSLPLPQTSTVISALSHVSLPGNDQLDSKLDEYADRRRKDTYCRYESSDNPAERELPSIPVYLHYDTPNPVCRSVGNEKMNRNSLCSLTDYQETFYHSIDESIAEQLSRYDYPIRNDPVERIKKNEEKCSAEENNFYYNISGQTCEKEKIENGAISNGHAKNCAFKHEEKENVCHKNGFSRIRPLIQKMEEIINQNESFKRKVTTLTNESKFSPSQTEPLKEEIYELVNSPTSHFHVRSYNSISNNSRSTVLVNYKNG